MASFSLFLVCGLKSRTWQYLKIFPPKSENVPDRPWCYKMCLPLWIFQIRVVLLKCACRMAFFNMCLADNLKDATDFGGLKTFTIFLTHKNLLNANSYIPTYFFMVLFDHMHWPQGSRIFGFVEHSIFLALICPTKCVCYIFETPTKGEKFSV